MKRSLKMAGTALVLCGLTASVKATIINYELTKEAAAGDYTYAYTVFNDSLAVPLTDFVIYFPELTYLFPPGPEYIYLAKTAIPGGWSNDPWNVVQPSAPNLNGFVEWSSLAGILPGDSLSGFKASFHYTGSGTPAIQFFEIYDDNFDLNDRGYTSTTAVPEPCTWIAGALATLLLAGRGVRVGWNRAKSLR